MSAVVGLYNLNGRLVEQKVVRNMVDTMPHRSPDGVGVWCEGSVGLAHGMLRTTPESLHETQPCSTAAGMLTIAADARIDNREELLDQLGYAKDEVLIADSELILAAYETWGRTCVDYLVGDFAFAIWDAQQQQLFCAKDHLGVNSLFFWHEPNTRFACSSEIKALTLTPGVDEEIDEEALATYMTRRLLEPEKTVFKGIRRLLPGHTLTVSPEGLQIEKYWEAGPSLEPVPSTDEACTAKFLALFREAVRCRLRSSFSVGSELSGGLDSSFVTCVARDLLEADEQQPLPTVSLVYDLFPGCDERSFIDKVVAQGGIEPHYCVVEEHALLDTLEEIYEYLDDGRAGGNHHLHWLTSTTAREAGIRVLLTGQDGDTTVYHGWERLSELVEAERWNEFAAEARLAAGNLREERGAYDMQETLHDPRHFVSGYAMPVLKQWAVEWKLIKLWRGIEALARHFPIPRRKLYRWLWRDAVLPPGRARARHSHAQAEVAKNGLPPEINPGLAQTLGLAERLAKQSLETPIVTGVRALQQQLLHSPYVVFNLEKTTLYAAANGMEVRHPFMDKRLVEYCLSLPSNQSYDSGWSRMVMRRAMEGIVPAEIQWRAGKTHSGAPYRHIVLERSVRKLKELGSQLETIASRYLNVPYLRGLMARKGDISDDEVRSLGNGMSIALWLQRRSNKGKTTLRDSVHIPHEQAHGALVRGQANEVEGHT